MPGTDQTRGRLGDLPQGYSATMRLDPDATAGSGPRTAPVPRSAELPQTSDEHLTRADLVWALIVGAVIGTAFVVPHLHLPWLSPVVHQSPGQNHALATTAPVLGAWLPHGNWSTMASVGVAAVVIGVGPVVARGLTWRPLLLVAWLGSLAWTVALTLIDGPVRGWAGRMDRGGGYLGQVPRHESIWSLVHGFGSHIAASSPAPWDISIAGDPPGALLTFVGLDRVGLSGAWLASALCVVVGTSAGAAVLVTVRALGDEGMARRAAPFVVLAPTAIWVGVSADGYFAGVAAWGIALLALAAGRSCRAPDAMAVGAGVLLGWAVYLDYGLILLAIPCVAVLVATRNVRPLLPAALAAVVVVACFTVSGFWWLGGLGHLRARYWAGIARDRPYRYWIWANLVSLTCAIGLPAAVAVRRAADRSALARRAALPVLLVAFLIVVVAADVSGLSKAETERIWLPFAVWLVAAPALLPHWTHRYLLVVQAIGALLINSLLFTTW